uniref:Uncharacterized protein LOC104211646 n=1 Tax=Nicotiana sylvestris TaxID=4096 RepID=A0A1U7V251_NICSY|nr:PREDICTED: uncharacterized protein LOC104211646 [Nicotiana sylvestris]
MAPYEVLHGRRCRSPIRWFEAGETNLLGLDLVQEVIDKVQLIRKRLLAAQSKLSPRFIGPDKIIDRVGVVAYRFALPPELTVIHPIFHVSMLRKCISDSSQVIEAPAIPLDEKLSYKEEPMAIIDRQIRKLWSKETVFVKVLWRNHTIEEATLK